MSSREKVVVMQQQRREVFGGNPVINFRDEFSRRQFFRGAAVIGVGATLATRYKRDPMAFAQGSMNDIEILNFALTLEFLEADFYAQGLEAGILSGRELELVTPIGEHEQIHVDTLTETITSLGGSPVESPMFTYPDGTFDGRDAFLMTASTFEELGVTAYHGQVANIESAEILGAAASIAGVESRHAAILADLLGERPFPEATVEASATMEQVLEAAMPFIEEG
jgi:rubrerythrin